MSRELDVLVCEHIFDWTWVTEDAEEPDQVPFLVSPEGGLGVYYPKVAAKFPNIQPTFLPAHSTSISAAWEVVEKLRALGWFVHIDNVGFNNEDEGQWRVFVQWFSDDDDNPRDGESHVSDADTAPEAICKAALLAVGALPAPTEET